MVASQRWWLPFVVIVATIAGCSYEPAPMPPRNAAPPSTASPSTAAPKASGPIAPAASKSAAKTPAQTGVASTASASTATPMANPSTAPPAPADLPVQLSAGMALAQTTLDGTQMGFSVDYQYRGAATFPLAADWVIQRPAGEPARVRVQLQASGTLATFLRWPPNEGPYQCRIEDTAGRPLSADESLR
jgi:hypothetical protein